MAIWTVALAAALATVYTPIYETMAAVAAILLYISYVLPTALGLVAYGHRWTTMGPWDLGAWYRPLAAISVVGCLALIAIGMHPPNAPTGRSIPSTGKIGSSLRAAPRNGRGAMRARTAP